MRRRVSSTGLNTLSKQVRIHGSPPIIVSRFLQGICSIFQRHGSQPLLATPLTYPIGEGVYHHPKVQNLKEEILTDEDKPYSLQLGLSRGDKKLMDHSDWSPFVLDRNHPCHDFGTLPQPVEIPIINTLA